MDKKKQLKEIEEWEGCCNPLESISVAKQGCINYLSDDFNMQEGVDFEIDGDGRWTDSDLDEKEVKNRKVFYLFKVRFNDVDKAIEVFEKHGLL